MTTRHILTVAVAMIATVSSAGARNLYGVTTTSFEEGNARVVSVDLDNLSDKASRPTPFTEISTIEHAADFMGGTMADGEYYCYYNTYDQVTEVSYQYFGKLNMTTGEFETIAYGNIDAMDDDALDLMDMTYDEVSGVLLGLDRQFVPSTYSFVSTIQNISMRNGKLSEVALLDRRYAALTSDGNEGFYLASVDSDGNEGYNATFYSSNNKFNVKKMSVSGSVATESTFAHSMVCDEENLYFASGTTLLVVDLSTKTCKTYYLEKELYGITLGINGDSGVKGVNSDAGASDCETEYYTLDGIRVKTPAKGSLIICRSGDKVWKQIY